MMNHVDLPVSLNTFCKLTDESIVAYNNPIAILLVRVRSWLELFVFHKLTKALENMEADGDLNVSLLYALGGK